MFDHLSEKTKLNEPNTTRNNDQKFNFKNLINGITLKENLKTTINGLKKYIKSKFVALTHSCTAALEISAILINLKKNLTNGKKILKLLKLFVMY